MRVVLGHETKRSRKTAAEPIGVGFKAIKQFENALCHAFASRAHDRGVVFI
jgi:hypothetical protein